MRHDKGTLVTYVKQGTKNMRLILQTDLYPFAPLNYLC